MFKPHKPPLRAFRRVTKTLCTFDEKPHAIARAGTATAHISTSARTKPLHTRKASSLAKERQRAEREQLTRLLKESPGKRDARNFLKQFDATKPKKTEGNSAVEAKHAAGEWGTARTGVNLGNLYQPTVFTRETLPDQKYDEEDREEPLHLALVKLRLPQTLGDETLRGIALTLGQMGQLGLGTALVLDCDEHDSLHGLRRNDKRFEKIVREQAARFCTFLEEYNEPGALIVDHALGHAYTDPPIQNMDQMRGPIEVENSFLLYPPLDDGIIPIILPFAYGDDLEKAAIDADEVMLALTRELSGNTAHAVRDNMGSGFGAITETSEPVERPTLDRIIILDPLGGIPSENRPGGAHVFVNLEAEYDDIGNELQRLENYSGRGCAARQERNHMDEPVLWSIDRSKPPKANSPERSWPDPTSAPMRHRRNLSVMQSALELLPPTSSGLILTPSEAATKAIPDDTRTMPAKNPLLHNLLTDRPMISSSLPTLSKGPRPSSITLPPANSTFLKKGVPLTMIPDPRGPYGPWRIPSTEHRSIDLAMHPEINLPKLVDLINDSFQRKLDAEAYLERIRGRVAGVIIAGDYEGGAICTWETPSWLLPFMDHHEGLITSHDDNPHHPMWIPYLDKFAVLTSSQGSGGIADIVWAALTRTCFPNGVVWRSRTSNPVNKWYQERAKGTWNLPGGDWTMFWTTDDVTKRWEAQHMRHVIDTVEADSRKAMGVETRDETAAKSRWDAYVDVCSKIKPNWADGIKRAD